MARFRSQIVGAERLRSLGTFEERLLNQLREVIRSKASALLAKAQSNVSTTLNVRKGRLLRSIRMKTYETEAGPGARVYSSYHIARFWEKGFGGKPANVKAHTRHVSRRDTRAAATGRRQGRRTGMGVAFVKAHTRNIPKQKRPFLRTALDSMRDEIRQAMARAVGR